MLRHAVLALAAVLAAALPAAAADDSRFVRTFDEPADLTGLDIIRGDWGVRGDAPAGAFPISPRKGGFAAFAVPDVNARTLKAELVLAAPAKPHRQAQIGVVVGDPHAGGTRPSYYMAVDADYFWVGQVPPGFLSGAPLPPPICAQRFGWRETTIRITLTNEKLIFRDKAAGATCTLSITASRPMGLLTLFGAGSGDGKGRELALRSISVFGKGAPVPKNHGDPRVRQYIRGLLN